MIEYTVDTGTSGQLKLVDNTDNPDLMTVVLWVKSSSPVSIPQFPWSYSIDGNAVSWRSFNFQEAVDWQRFATIYVGENAETFTFHIGDTGSQEVGGPAQLSIDIYGGSSQPQTVDVKVGTSYKKAIPYVRDNGVWKIAAPYIKTSSGWQTIH